MQKVIVKLEAKLRIKNNLASPKQRRDMQPVRKNREIPIQTILPLKSTPFKYSAMTAFFISASDHSMRHILQAASDSTPNLIRYQLQLIPVQIKKSVMTVGKVKLSTGFNSLKIYENLYGRIVI